MRRKKQIFDSAAKVWRKVVVDSVSARWVDLGTRLVLRHVVRVVGAEAEERAGKDGGGGGAGSAGRGSDNQEIPEDKQQKRGEGTRRSGGEKGRAAVIENDKRGGVGGAATVEVDLNEVRWAEVTGGEQQRESEAEAKKNLAGASFLLSLLNRNCGVCFFVTDGLRLSSRLAADKA